MLCSFYVVYLSTKEAKEAKNTWVSVTDENLIGEARNFKENEEGSPEAGGVAFYHAF